MRVFGSNKQELVIDGFGYDEEKQFFVIFLGKKLHKGDNLTVSVDFTGRLDSDSEGNARFIQNEGC